MLIEQFDGATDTERLRRCFDIAAESWRVDTPHLPAWSFGSFSGKWGHGYDSQPRQCWLASDDTGAAVGSYLLSLPEPENHTLATAILTVRPSRRRAGIGRALLAHCARQARAAGRTRLTGNAWDDSPGAAFAAAVGARSGITEVTRTLEVGEDLPARLTSLRRAALPYAAGYSMVTWQGVTPEQYLADVARVHAAMADAPRDAGVEPSGWDVDRVRHLDATAADHGVIFYSAAARDSTSGEFAALTQICTDPGAPGWGIQQITAVRPEHRGHRLGLLAKIAMLELLAREAPDVRRFITGNAGANAHMISINDQLGFAVVGCFRSWELDITSSSAQS